MAATEKKSKEGKKNGGEREGAGRKKAILDFETIGILFTMGYNGKQVAQIYGLHPGTLYRGIENKFGIPFTQYRDERRAECNEVYLKAQLEAKRIRSKKQHKDLPLHERVSASIRAAIAYHLKNASIKKDFKTFERLGYSKEDLINHLQSKFSKGMNFDNYGEWHIDHIIPVSWFDLSDPYQFKQCWRLSNLQPKWAKDNMSKGNRFSENAQLKLMM